VTSLQRTSCRSGLIGYLQLTQPEMLDRQG
jgi:hypothetical protein